MTNQLLSKEPVPGQNRAQTGRVQPPFSASIIGVLIGIIFPLLYFPFLFFSQFYFGNYTSVSQWELALLLYAAGALYFFLVMPYHISSMYLRYAMLIPFLSAVALSLVKSSRLPFWPVDFNSSGLTMLLTLIIIAFFVSMSARALRGCIYRKPTIQLAFPLRSGCYSVSQGGSNRIINCHAGTVAQHYANDVVKLNRWGSRARGLYPRQLDSYCIFEDTVYSPCDGLIINTIDGLPDLAPGEMDRTQPAGNHIIIKYQDEKILLAHLQQNSILVNPGEQVRQGQPVGKIGNSGNTSEPHLHIHAEYRGNADRFGDGVGIPILFKEKGFLKRNDLLVIRDKVPMESNNG